MPQAMARSCAARSGSRPSRLAYEAPSAGCRRCRVIAPTTWAFVARWMAGSVDSLFLRPIDKTQTVEILSRDLRDDVFRYSIPEAIGSTTGALWLNLSP